MINPTIVKIVMASVFIQKSILKEKTKKHIANKNYGTTI